MPVDASKWRDLFHMAQIRFPGWAHFAPDQLLYASTESGTWQLHHADLTSLRSQQITFTPGGTMVGALTPDGRHIWWFDDQSAGEVGVWRIQPVDGGTSTALACPPSLSTGLAVGTRHAVVGVADDRTSRILLVGADLRAEVIYEHHEHSAVHGMSTDGAFVVASLAEHGDSRHPTIAVLDMRGRVVRQLWDGHQQRLRPGAWSPLSGDNRLIVHHEREQLLRPAVWLPTDDVLRPLAVDLPGEVTATWYPDGRKLLLVHDWKARTELFTFDLVDNTLSRVIHPRGTIAGAAVRPDGTVWTLYGDASHSSRLRGDDRAQELINLKAATARVTYADLQVGLIHGLLAEPAGPRPHPTIFIVHGGPGIHDRDVFSPETHAWLAEGFAVVRVNYRGSTGYGQSWRDAIQAPPGPGLCELHDLAAVRHHLIASGVSDATRMIISGHSWGGYLTLLALGRQPDLWSLGIALKPIADWTAAYEDEAEPTRAHDRALFGCSPHDAPEYFAARSPITYAADVRAPVLITASTNDPHCPRRQIDNYLDALAAASRAFEAVETADGHNARHVPAQVHALERQIDFVRRHLH